MTPADWVPRVGDRVMWTFRPDLDPRSARNVRCTVVAFDADDRLRVIEHGDYYAVPAADLRPIPPAPADPLNKPLRLNPNAAPPTSFAKAEPWAPEDGDRVAATRPAGAAPRYGHVDVTYAETDETHPAAWVELDDGGRELFCVDELAPAESAEPPVFKATATCYVCGGPATAGLAVQWCEVPGGCPGPRVETEPDVVCERWEGAYLGVERLYQALGRGHREVHPTKEGAIAAWREAVRRGG